MSFRFQRRLKLFPGVRLNFSRGGISTTIGVRGASVTLGGKGTYVNLGIPGSGFSYRERIAPRANGRPSAPRRPLDASPSEQSSPSLRPEPVPAPEQSPNVSVAGAIRIAPVSTLTSVGLDELKKLINEATLQRVELTGAIAVDTRALREAERRLQHARWFIVRLFTTRSLPRLSERVVTAEATLDGTRRKLAGCSIEIEFAFDQPTLGAFAALVREFEGLTGCQKIWDITASVATDRFVERTTADHRIIRKPVRLNFSQSEVIDTNYKALYFTNANGNDIYVYPGFVMMLSPGGDFALIDVRELQVGFAQSNFIEEDSVPADSEIVGQTWKKANKDGSRDRRFAGNYQIPIARYAELEFRSSTGLYEVYQFSNYPRAISFFHALTDYQKAVAALAERSREHSLMPLIAPSDDESEDADAETAFPSAHSIDGHPSPPRYLIFDFAALVVCMAVLGSGTVYFVRSPINLQFPLRSFTQPETQAIPIPVGATQPQTEPSRQTPLDEPTAKGIVYIRHVDANVRAEPSSASPVVTHEHVGKRLNVFQRQGTWVQIGEQSPIGWVHQSLLGAAPP